MKFLLAGAALLLAGCTNHNLSPPGTITVATGSVLQSVNPLFATDALSQHMTELLHVALVRINERLLPEPYLAESFRYVNDFTLEFKLRAGCRFPTGRALTSADVARSLAYLQDAAQASPYAETFRRIVRFERVDDLTFRLHTAKPAPSLPSDLELLKILDFERLPGGSRATHLPGFGPYELRELSSSGALLERAPPSCLPAPPTPRLRIKVVRDDLSRYFKLKTGEVDVVLNELNYRKVETISQTPGSGLRVEAVDGIGYSYLGLNLRTPALRDPRVRRAIALSFDVPALNRYKSRGMATVARNILADQNYYANLAVPRVERDLPAARRLLDEAGYGNGQNHKAPLRLTLLTSNSSFNIENAQVLVAQAREAGIELHHRALEWGVFYANVKAGDTEIYMSRWVGSVDPRIYFENFHSGEIGRGNRTFYQNPELDKLTDLGETLLDRAARKQVYDKVQALVARDLPYIGLWYGKHVTVMRDSVRDLSSHPSGSWKPLLRARKK